MNLKTIAPPLEEEKERLCSLLVALKRQKSEEDKNLLFSALPEVDLPLLLQEKMAPLSLEAQLAIKATFAIGQGRLFEAIEHEPLSRFLTLVKELVALERFYQDEGGIVGYQHLVLTLLTHEKEERPITLTPPEGVLLSQKTAAVKQAIIEGIKRQGKMAELYPVGGAADRLQLKDEVTEEGLPAARLNFLGKPLLEGVIADLQAREYLHYKLFGAQVTTPIGMMTSDINRNHFHIKEICKQNHWFGRPKESFRFFTQPSVPTFTRDGQWCLQKPLKLLLKPGGHGMLWKLLKKNKVFEWLNSQGVKKALVRQINNPMAAIDDGLLAFLGIGHLEDRAFGFASCPRLVNAQEGMNVVKVIGDKKVLTNIEYCDFEKCGIKDKPLEKGGTTSRFPSNTNILFADLAKIQQVQECLPHPGLLVNFRKGAHYHSNHKKEEIARLETTMQNIADGLLVSKETPLPTYLTFNERRKTISTTKRKSGTRGSFLETPEGCYYDYMLNAKELLENHCHMSLPPFPGQKRFAKEGPSFLFSYHPALGPLYSVIGQKLRGGKIHEGSELQLELADLNAENLNLQGSLQIQATHVMGHYDQGLLRYSDRTGQCHLKNVTVKNRGIDWEEDHLFWNHEIARVESLKITLHGHAQFIAEDVTLEGDLSLDVPSGMKMTAKKERGRVIFITEPLESNVPLWEYTLTKENGIKLD
ncbi:MAG: UTP--glucose-1-phosphate uridylyltransferase [Chlamydiia bacterium]|nr:UTP--glucose-1-phosphate uridylyltransferase [Chlamydiia bacterium]